MNEPLLPLDFNLSLTTVIDARVMGDIDRHEVVDELFAAGALNTQLIDEQITVEFPWIDHYSVEGNKQWISDRIRIVIRRLST